MRVYLTIICLILIFFPNETLEKGGRGGGSRWGGGSRRYGSTSRRVPSSIGKTKINTKKAIIAGALLYPTAKLLTNKRSYGHRSFPYYDDDYIYYDSDYLPDVYYVNGNEYYTPFLLVLSKDRVYNCLIVPKSTRRGDCRKVFSNHVTNATRFLLPREYEEEDDFLYNSPSRIRPVRDIALCCGSTGILPNAFVLLGFIAICFCFGNFKC